MDGEDAAWAKYKFMSATKIGILDSQQLHGRMVSCLSSIQRERRNYLLKQ